MELKIKRESDLWECESVLNYVTKSAEPVHIQLSQIDRKIPMKDLRVVPIISALSRTGTGTCSWEKNMSTENQNPLIDLAMKIYPVTEENRQNNTLVDNEKRLLANRLDILEIPPGKEETLTVCAIDQKWKGSPLSLPTKFEKTEFIREFGKLIQEHFDIGTSTYFSTSIGPSLFDYDLSNADRIFGFVYELYHNTFNHGCLDKNNCIIPGIRLIRLRKRVGHSQTRNTFIENAKGFTELKSFFQSTAPSGRSFKYYEISISDNGMGILNRFRNTIDTSELNPGSRDANLRLLNRIVGESLSSDSTKSGKGEGGLKNVLKAVDEVRGFVSLRCDNLWVYRNSKEHSDNSQDNWLKPVQDSGELATIPGTHFTILLSASK